MMNLRYEKLEKRRANLHAEGGVYVNRETLKTIAENMREFDFARSRIALRIVNPRQETELLRSLPHLPCMDLAFIFVVFFNRDPHAQMTAAVRTSHLEQWGIAPEELLPIAAANSPRCMPPHLESIADLLGISEDAMEKALLTKPEQEEDALPPGQAQKKGGLPPEPDSDAVSAGREESPLYVLTTRQGIYGAAAMLYPGILRSFAAAAGDDLYIIPSSVHEVLLQAKGGAPDVQDMNAIIREINAGEVQPKERLSDHVYLYSREKDLIFDPLCPSCAIRPFAHRPDTHLPGEIREITPYLRPDRTVAHTDSPPGTAFL